VRTPRFVLGFTLGLVIAAAGCSFNPNNAACSGDQDCATGYYCDPGTHVCQQGPRGERSVIDMASREIQPDGAADGAVNREHAIADHAIGDRATGDQTVATGDTLRTDASMPDSTLSCSPACTAPAVCMQGVCRVPACTGVVGLPGPPGAFTDANDTTTAALVVGDLNGDSLPDIVAAVGDINIMFGTGKGTFGGVWHGLPYPENFSDVVMADFNSDGVPDLAWVGTSGVHVAINMTATGFPQPTFAPVATFNPMVTSLPTNGLAGLVAVDLNGDHHPDLAVNAGGQLSTLINKTPVNGTTPMFNNPAVITVTGGVTAGNTSVQGFTAGDLNGDGVPDIVLGGRPSGGSQPLGVLINQTATGATSTTFGSEGTIYTGLDDAVVLADINNDSKLDVIAGSPTSNTNIVQVLVNTTATAGGAPTFATATPVQVTPDSTGTTAWIGAGDLNQDGLADLVTFNDDQNTPGNTLGSVLLSTSSGTNVTFAKAVPFPNGLYALGTVGAVADVTGDAVPDIVMGSNGDDTVVTVQNVTPLNATTASLVVPTYVMPYLPPATSFCDPPTVYTQSADFNGDGISDLVTDIYSMGNSICTQSFAQTSVFLSNGVNYAETNFPQGCGFGNPHPLRVADVNGDAIPDLLECGDVFVNQTAKNGILANFSVAAPATVVGLDAGSNLLALDAAQAIADLDGDGMADAVYLTGSTGIALYRNSSAKGAASITFQPPHMLLSPSNDAGAIGVAAVTAADLDNDGKPDLAALGSDGLSIEVFLNRSTVGALSFAPGQSFPLTGPGVPNGLQLAPGFGNDVLQVGDFNHDGLTDLVYFFRQTGGMSTKGAEIAFNQGVGAGQGFAAFFAYLDYNLGQADALVADADGDGQPDLVVVDGAHLELYLNRTTPRTTNAYFRESAPYSNVVPYTAGITAGDFNHDGRTDFAVGTDYPLANVLLLNQCL
jgi:hypothetical protein